MNSIVLKILLPVDIRVDEPTALAMSQDKKIYLQMIWTKEIQDKFGLEKIGHYKVNLRNGDLKILEKIPDQEW